MAEPGRIPQRTRIAQLIGRGLATGVLIAVLVNLVAIAAGLWSRGGQTSTVSIEMEGNRFRVLIDGRQILPTNKPGEPPRTLLEAPAQGSISLTLLKPNPAVPHPQGVDSVVVTDLQGKELYREDFKNLYDPRWEITEGDFKAQDGVLTATAGPWHNTIVFKDAGWGDQILTVKYRNTWALEIGARLSGEGGINFGADLVRDFPIYLEGYKANGDWTGTFFADRIQTNRTQMYRSLSAMLLKSYPFLLIGGVVGVVASTALALTGRRFAGLASRLLEKVRAAKAVGVRLAGAQWPLKLVMLLAVGSFALTLYIIYVYYEHVPHLPDESSYMFQAKLFAAGKIVGTLPPVKEAFYAWIPNFMVEYNGHWATLYPFGHPLILVPGAIIGAMWLIPPIVGAGSVVLIFLVGRRLYDTRTGLISAVLLAGSPFFLMQSSNLMSHNTWTFFMLLSLLFLLKRERPVLYGALAGLFFGLALNTRTVEAAMLIPPFGVVLASYLWPVQTRRENLKYVGAFLCGGGVMVLAMLGYNASITGDPLTPPYVAWGADTLGFVNGHTYDIGLRTMQSHLMGLILVFNAWPAWVGLSFVMLPFLLGTRDKRDYFLLACAVLVAVVYILYATGMLYMGPRYWYQAVPFLILLTVRGADLGARLLGDAATRLRARLAGDSRDARWAGYLVVYSCLGVLVVWGTGGWLFGWHKDWTELDVPQVQNNLSEVEFIYGFDDRLLKLEKLLKPKNALILVKSCGRYNGFGCYNTVWDRNTVNFDGNVVWAHYDEETNAEVIASFPGRTVYVADVDESSIQKYRP